MSDISDQPLNLTTQTEASPSCAGKLLGDIFHTSNQSGPAAAIDKNMDKLGYAPANCLEFTALPQMEKSGPGTVLNGLNGLNDLTAGTAASKFSSGNGWTPYLGLASDSAPGQRLAFDSNFKRLEFQEPSKTAVPDIHQTGANNLDSLRFDHKFSAALIFGVNMKF